MNITNTQECIAFDQYQRIAKGDLAEVAKQVKRHLKEDINKPILIFNCETSEPIEVDFRGSVDEITKRISHTSHQTQAEDGETPSKPQKGPGRPKLGVISKEVTLLPRHWQWLKEQPGGASVTLRKLVENAKRVRSNEDNARKSQQTTYGFLTALAGNLPKFEEVIRALFAKDKIAFTKLIEDWPADVREHTHVLSSGAFSDAN